MKVEYRPSAHKSLKKIPQKNRAKILETIDLLPKNPFAGKKLEGKYKKLRSLRIWPYRVIYTVKENIIFIISITHRQSAYKN